MTCSALELRTPKTSLDGDMDKVRRPVRVRRQAVPAPAQLDQGNRWHAGASKHSGELSPVGAPPKSARNPRAANCSRYADGHKPQPTSATAHCGVVIDLR